MKTILINKNESKKGVSLIVLAITVIVMVMITGIILINSETMLTNVNKTKLQTDIVQLESLMNTYRIRNNGVIDFETVEFDASKLTEIELSQFEGENIQNNKISLCIIDLLKIDADSVNFGNLVGGENDRYLYSATTQKVYYEQGIEIDGITYHYVKDGEK